MKLHTVTITGADDSTDIRALVDLSAEFPFVEWAILISKSQEGGIRFPSRPWIDAFVSAATSNGLKVATHICGRWVREFLSSTLDVTSLPAILQAAARVQINTHVNPQSLDLDSAQASRLATTLGGPKQLIFQWNGVNDHLAPVFHSAGVNTAALFDASGGAGKLPGEWPAPIHPFPCGFAGGLGPNNVMAELDRIAAVCPNGYTTWIDMEGRVRVPDLSALDLNLVRRVLEQVAASQWIAPSRVLT